MAFQDKAQQADTRKYIIKDGTKAYEHMNPLTFTKDEYIQFNGNLCKLVYSDEDAGKLFDLHGYTEDTSIRRPNMRVFVDEAHHHGIVVYRGTVVTSAKDLGADVAIAAHAQKLSPSFHEALEYFDLAKTRHAGVEFATAGHSLGGAKAMYVAKQRNSVRALAINPGISPVSRTRKMLQKMKGGGKYTGKLYDKYVKDRSTRMQEATELLKEGGRSSELEDHVVIVRNELDPISAAGPWKNYNTVEYPQKKFTWVKKGYRFGDGTKKLLSHHSIDQFANFQTKAESYNPYDLDLGDISDDYEDVSEGELIDDDLPITEKTLPELDEPAVYPVGYEGDHKGDNVPVEIEMQDMSAKTRLGVKRKAADGLVETTEDVAADAARPAKKTRPTKPLRPNGPYNKDAINEWYSKRSNLREAENAEKWGLEKVGQSDEFMHVAGHMNDPEIMNNPDIKKYQTHTGRVYSEADELRMSGEDWELVQNRIDPFTKNMGYPKGATDAEAAFKAQKKINAYIESKNATNIFKKATGGINKGVSAVSKPVSRAFNYTGEALAGSRAAWASTKAAGADALEILGGPEGIILMEAMGNMVDSIPVQQDVNYNSIRDYYKAQFQNARFRESHTSAAGGNKQTYFTDYDRANMESWDPSKMGTAFWMDTAGEWQGYHISEDEMSKRAAANIYKYHPETKHYSVKGKPLEDVIYSNDPLDEYYQEVDAVAYYKKRYESLKPEERFLSWKKDAPGVRFDPRDEKQVERYLEREGGALQNYKFQQMIKNEVVDKLDSYKRSKKYRGSRLDENRAVYDAWMESSRKGAPKSGWDDYRHFEVLYWEHPGFRAMLRDQGIDAHTEYKRLVEQSGIYEGPGNGPELFPTLEEYLTNPLHYHKPSNQENYGEIIKEDIKNRPVIYNPLTDFDRGSVIGKNILKFKDKNNEEIIVLTGEGDSGKGDTTEGDSGKGDTREENMRTVWQLPTPPPPQKFPDGTLPPSHPFSAHPGGSSTIPTSQGGVVEHMGNHPGHSSGTPIQQHGGTNGTIQPNDGTAHTTDHLNGFTSNSYSTINQTFNNEYHNHDAYNPIQSSSNASTNNMPTTALPKSQLDLLTSYQTKRGKQLRSMGAHNSENLAFIADAAAAARAQRSSYNS